MSKIITLEQWKERVYYLNPHMHILNEILPQGTKEDPFICHCDDCGATFPTTKQSINNSYCRYKNNTNNKWCPVCNNQLCIAGINDIVTTNPEIIKYLKNEEDSKRYTHGSHKKILCKCPICGDIRPITIYNLCIHGYSCNICSDSISFPNKICRHLLFQLPIDEFEFEYTEENFDKRVYDAYFKYFGIRYLLEFDGEQHYRDSGWSSLIEQKENDNYKTLLANNNEYILIRIDCRLSDFEYIKSNIFNSQLNNIFDLNVLDWDLIYKNSLKNYDIEIANYYMNNKDKSLYNIASDLHISCSSLTNILKKTSKLGFCGYQVRDIKKNISKYTIRRLNGEIFYFNIYDKYGKHIGRFKSIKDCKLFIHTQFKNLNIPESVVNFALFTGDSYKGIRFEYEVGLYNYHKDNLLLFDICNAYNRGMIDFDKLSIKYDISKEIVSKYLRTGNNMGICKYKARMPKKTYWQQAC